jgi:hypothetical protein
MVRRSLTFSARTNNTHTLQCIYILCKCGPTAATVGRWRVHDLRLHTRGGGGRYTSGRVYTTAIHLQQWEIPIHARGYICVCVCVCVPTCSLLIHTHTHMNGEKDEKIKRRDRVYYIYISRLWQQRMAGSAVDDIRTRLYIQYARRCSIFIHIYARHYNIRYCCLRRAEGSRRKRSRVCVCVCVAIVFHYCYYIGTRTYIGNMYTHTHIYICVYICKYHTAVPFPPARHAASPWRPYYFVVIIYYYILLYPARTYIYMYSCLAAVYPPQLQSIGIRLSAVHTHTRYEYNIVVVCAIFFFCFIQNDAHTIYYNV